MRYIRNIYDDQNKSGDTDNTFRFNLLQGEDIFNFGDYPISINIANSSGYILSMVPEKEFGNSVLKLDFNEQSLKSLTPDNYLLEVEVKFPDGTTATFPTKGGMPFTVNSNLKNTAGQLVPTITFDEVLNAVDEKVENYLATVVKGDKGDTGATGPMGEVDTSKDYTFTGKETFTKLITGAFATKWYGGSFTDLNQVASDIGHFAGRWMIDGSSVANSPEGGWIIIDVVPNDNLNAGVIFANVLGGRSFYYSNINFTGRVDWIKVSNDDTVLHNTGNETATGDKTFTGNNTFTQPIDGALKVRVATFADFTTVAQNMVLYSGLWVVNGATILNSPEGTSYWLNVEVQSGDWYKAGVIKIYDRVTQYIYYSTVADGVLGPWKKIAKDDTVVHNTGTETVAGDKTFTGKNTFTGQTSFWFKQIQWNSGIMQGTWYIQRIGNWVNAKFDMSANTATGTTTLTLPVGYRPLSSFVRELEQGTAGIAKTGTVFISQVYTDSNAMTFSYPTNDTWPTA